MLTVACKPIARFYKTHTQVCSSPGPDRVRRDRRYQGMESERLNRRRAVPAGPPPTEPGDFQEILKKRVIDLKTAVWLCRILFHLPLIFGSNLLGGVIFSRTKPERRRRGMILVSQEVTGISASRVDAATGSGEGCDESSQSLHRRTGGSLGNIPSLCTGGCWGAQSGC